MSRKFASPENRRAVEPVRKRRLQPFRHATAWGSILCLFASLGVAWAAGKPSQPPLASISVKTAKLGSRIPSRFVGLSLEVSTQGQALPVPPKKQQLASQIHPAGEFVYSLGAPGDPNLGYFQLMRNLGPAILRLGGNSQDNTCWDKKAAPHPALCHGPITPGDMKLYSEAAGATGWRLILGINLKQDAPKWALSEITQGVARYIHSDQILALEIGNEPSLFPYDGSRRKNYSLADYLREYRAYASAFAENPVAKKYALAAPAECCRWENTKDLEAIMDGLRHTNLKLVTVHEYVATTCGGRTVTLAQLLAPKTTDGFIRRARGWVVAAHRRGLPIALAETNSASCGGMAGVSNAFASAVWGLDYMFQVARDGFSSINFHTSYRAGGSAYSPVVSIGTKTASGRWHYQNTAQPLYYAMYMFARNAEKAHFLPASIDTGANVRAYAVSACPHCAVKVFVINKDLKAAGRVRVHVAGRKTSATLLLLHAPSLGSTASAVRYGGEQFDTNGHIRAPHVETLRPNSEGNFVFDLPNASAALLTVASPSK
jgi:hypothetical protein